MTTKLIQIGDAFALVIDPALLKQLNITQETLLDVRVEGDRLVITPIPAGDHRQKVREAIEWPNANHAATLKKLAE